MRSSRIREVRGLVRAAVRDAFRESADAIMNAPAFLRWAAVNLLPGSWDNYYARRPGRPGPERALPRRGPGRMVPAGRPGPERGPTPPGAGPG
jgi:hypothetical protein